MGFVDGKYVVNPNAEEREKSKLHLIVSGTQDAVMMVEAGADEITEEQMLGAILFAHEEIKKICAFISDIKEKIGKPEIEVNFYHIPDELDAAVREKYIARMEWAMDTFDRIERQTREAQVKKEAVEFFIETYSKADVENSLYNIMKEVIRDKIVNAGVRPDGRGYEDIRPIWCETGIFARTHGSAGIYAGDRRR